jgi:hypothetical protein
MDTKRHESGKNPNFGEQIHGQAGIPDGFHIPGKREFERHGRAGGCRDAF